MGKFKNGDYAWDNLNKQKVRVCMGIEQYTKYLVFPIRANLPKYSEMITVKAENLKPAQFEMSQGDKDE